MSEHMLIFGNGYYIPDRLRTWARTTGQSVSTSVLCHPEQMVKIDEPEKLARIVVLPAEATLDEWLAWARLVHELEPVTRIGSFSDQGQDIAAAAGQALGLPAHSPETVRPVHDKYAMRQRLAEAGVESTASAIVRRRSRQVRDFAAAHGYPCVVKPVSGMASSGVSVIFDPAEAEAAVARARGITRAQGTTTPVVMTTPRPRRHRPAQAPTSAAAPDAEQQPLATPIQVIVENVPVRCTNTAWSASPSRASTNS